MNYNPKNIKMNRLPIKFSSCILMIFIIFLCSCSRNFSYLSKTENKYNLSKISDLENNAYSKKIEDFYNSGKEGTFIGKADVKIYYKIFEQKNTDKVILISSGRTEAAIKYKELIFDLFNNGYSIYIHDHRGQGLSGRMLKDPQMGYVDSFQYYIDDTKSFYDNYLKLKNYKNIYLLSHSMGGAIGMTYLEQYPNDFKAAAFSSPMLGFNPPICTLVKIFKGKEPKYAMGQSEYNEDKSTFKGNTLTGSRLRYDKMIEAFSKEPKARLGGVTYHWLDSSCKQFDYIFNNANKIKTPIILISAENEQIVYPYAHQKFMNVIKKLNKDCIAYEVKNAQHELFIEKDEQRIESITAILDFYSNY